MKQSIRDLINSIRARIRKLKMLLIQIIYLINQINIYVLEDKGGFSTASQVILITADGVL